MERLILEKLIKWKQSNHRKPLILKGARQVGKTYILKQFGKENYEGVAYFNFDHDKDLYNLFENTKNPKRILEQLAFIYGKAIIPGKTLIIFDEIQECPNALNSLKYFQEEANEYHIACAGSLLGIRLSHTSFPVGKVEFLNMYPMSFTEFLKADNAENLVEYMESINEIQNIPEIFQNQLEEKLKAYFIIGGMPEAVYSWINYKDMEQVNQIQDDILKAYESDFSKHTQNSEANKISLIWNSIPSQLAKENKKFQYSKVSKGGRSKDYMGCVEWLKDAGLINVCECLQFPELPLKGNVDESKYKVYISDTGLLVASLDDESQMDLRANKNLGIYKGALYENFAAEALVKQGYGLYYYSKDNSTLEEDFFIRSANELVPVDVKANANRSKSLRQLIKSDAYADIKHGIKLMAGNVGINEDFITFPYFCAFLLKRYMREQNIFQ